MKENFVMCLRYWQECTARSSVWSQSPTRWDEWIRMLWFLLPHRSVSWPAERWKERTYVEKVYGVNYFQHGTASRFFPHARILEHNIKHTLQHNLRHNSLPRVGRDQPVVHRIIGDIFVFAVIHQVDVLCTLDCIAKTHIQYRVVLVRLEVQIAAVRGVWGKPVRWAVHEAPLQESVLRQVLRIMQENNLCASDFDLHSCHA